MKQFTELNGGYGSWYSSHVWWHHLTGRSPALFPSTLSRLIRGGQVHQGMRVALLLRAMPNNKVDNKHSLVGGFNPSEKYERQSGSMKFPTQWTNKKN